VTRCCLGVMRSSPASLKRPAVLSHPQTPQRQKRKGRRFGGTSKGCCVEQVNRRHQTDVP